MIKKGDKLIIVAEALEDEKAGTVYVKLTSDSQSNMTMLTENCIVVPKQMENGSHGKSDCKDAQPKKLFDYRKYNGYEDVLKGEYVFESEKDAEEFWKTSSVLAPPEQFQLRNGEYRWAVSYMK